MFGFAKQIFVLAIMFSSLSILSVNSLKYVSMNNQWRKIRPQITIIYSNKPIFYPYSVKKLM